MILVPHLREKSSAVTTSTYRSQQGRGRPEEHKTINDLTKIDQPQKEKKPRRSKV